MDSITGMPDLSLRTSDKRIFGGILAAGGLLAAGALYTLYRIMPMLVDLAQNTLYFMLEIGGIVLLAMFFYEWWLSRQAIEYKLKLIARNLRKAVIKSDPIGVINVAIGNFQSRLEDADAKSRDADAALKDLAKKIKNDSKTGLLDQALNEENLGRAAEKAGRSADEVNVHLVNAERARRAADSLQPILERQKARKIQFEKARKMCETGLMNLKSQKSVMSVQLDALKADAAQSRAFKRFFSNNADREMIDMAVEEIEKQSSSYEAEIEQVMRQAEPLIASEELQQNADAMAARTRLGFDDKKALAAPAVALSLDAQIKEAELVAVKK